MRVGAIVERGWQKSCAKVEGILDGEESTNLDLLGAATFFGKAGSRFVQRIEVAGTTNLAFSRLSSPSTSDDE